MKLRWVWLGLAATFALGWFLASGYRRSELARLEVSRDSLDRVLAAHELDRVRREAEDSARADSARLATERAAAAERARREADRRTAEARAELAEHLAGDTAGSRQLADLEEAHASALRADSATMAELRRVIAFQDRRIAVLRDSTVPELRRDLAEAIRQREGYREAARRSFLERVGPPAVAILATIGGCHLAKC